MADPSLRTSCPYLFCSLASRERLPLRKIGARLPGTITDAQGASIAGAKVQAKNLGTQVTYDSVTTDAGVYTIPLVPPGNYSVTASHDGFKSSVNPNFEVRVSDHVQIDLSLQVGAITQEVTVTTQAPSARNFLGIARGCAGQSGSFRSPARRANDNSPRHCGDGCAVHEHHAQQFGPSI